MPFNPNELKAALIGGGSRPSQFNVQITNRYGSIAGDQKLQLTCEAASLPATTIGEIIVNYFGRQIKYAGDRTYQNWTVTVINDEDFLVRREMERWIEAINSVEGNVRLPQAAGSLYKSSQAQVIQYGKNSVPVHSVQFEGFFPVNVQEIPLGWGDQNTISRFQVTFAYDHFKTIL